MSALRNVTLKVTPAKDFNDPFEILPGIPEKLVAKDVVRSLVAPDGLFRRMAAMRGFQNVDEANYLARVVAAVNATPKDWPTHARTMVESIAHTFRRSLALCCFAAFSDTELCNEMGIRHWAAYADDHRGIAIEYDGRHSFFRSLAKQKLLFPVEYCANRVQIHLAEFDNWNDAKLWHCLRRWSGLKCRRAWGSEKEWRMILPLHSFLKAGFIKTIRIKGRAVYLLKISTGIPANSPPDESAKAIRRVVIGARASKTLIRQVLAITSRPEFRHAEV